MIPRHRWIPKDYGAGLSWPVCRNCGVVRRADKKNKPCNGPAKIDVRAEKNDRPVGGPKAAGRKG